MDKLNVFSEKLGEAMEVVFNLDGVLVTPEGISMDGSAAVFAWNNSSGSWLDRGWNNSSGSWQDRGWCNSSGSWIDKGWSNSSGRWSDKGWSNTSGSWGDAGGGGGCYITTACVEHKGLDDNCHELKVLREYRDRLVEEDEEFRLKVLEYYRKAPLIVQEINQDEGKDDILEELYDSMIVRCVSLLEEGRTEEAKTVYLDSYESLAERFLAG